MLWGKQYFFLDTNRWLEEHDAMATTAPGSAPAIQTGWTGMVGGLIEYFGQLDQQAILEGRQRTGFDIAKAQGTSAKAIGQ
jgi:hypothetical protein